MGNFSLSQRRRFFFLPARFLNDWEHFCAGGYSEQSFRGDFEMNSI